MKRKRWYIGNCEVTVRELLASVTIVAVMFLLGFIISDKIAADQAEKNAEYYQAIHIEDEDMFHYGMETDVGNAFVYGTLAAVDTVTYPEIGGEYLYLEKVEEHYNMHTRTVTRTVNGKTQTHTEIYWSWDYAGSEEIHSRRIRFLGVEFDYFKIKRPGANYIDMIQESGHVRFKYYGCNPEYIGTIYTELRNGTITDQTKFWNDRGIEQVLEDVTSQPWVFLFWVIWGIVTLAAVYLFVMLDNRWLEE